MNARLFVFCGLLVLTVGAVPKPKPSPAHAPTQTLHQFVALMLLQAPADYAKMRGERKDADVYRIRYNPATQFAASCYKCVITDEFAWTGHAENWNLEQEWNAHKWKPAQVQKYVADQLNALLKGYTFSKSDSKDYPTFTWHNGATGLWVSVETYNGGLRPRIGQDLAKPVHELKAPTPADITALRNAVTNFVTLGVPPASSNFTTLRTTGKKDELGSMEYAPSVSFGAVLRNCRINDDSVNTLGLDDFSPKWIMNCDTVPMVGAVADIEPQIKEATAEALPSGYTVTTGKYLGIDDYRWDNSNTSVAVDIDSFSGFLLPKGLVSFGVGIIHFLPKPAST